MYRLLLAWVVWVLAGPALAAVQVQDLSKVQDPSAVRSYRISFTVGDNADTISIPNNCAQWRASFNAATAGSISVYAHTTPTAAANTGTLLGTFSTSSATVTTFQTSYPYLKAATNDPTAGTAELFLYCAKEASGSDSFVDVRSFGAACDGTTDDTAAIQAAIDASVATGSQTIRVRIPKRICRATQIILRYGTWLEGDTDTQSVQKSIIRALDEDLDLLIDDPGQPEDHIHGVKVRDMWLQAATFPTTSTGTGMGINIDGQRYGESTKFENLWAEDFGSHGINIGDGCAPCYLENIHVNENGGYGLYFSGGGGDPDAQVLVNHISGDANGQNIATGALIGVDTAGNAWNGEHYVFQGIKSECGQSQLYGVRLEDLNGTPVHISGMSHRCGTEGTLTGSAAIWFGNPDSGSTNVPRLSWDAIDVQTDTEYWIIDGISGVNSVLRTQDKTFGTLGALRASRLFAWASNLAGDEGCNAGSRGKIFYDTDEQNFKMCVNSSTPAYMPISTYEVGATSTLTCAAAIEGRQFYDTNAGNAGTAADGLFCVCSDASGAFLWHPVDTSIAVTANSTTDCGT